MAGRSVPCPPPTPPDLGWRSVSRKFIGEGSWDPCLGTGMGRLGEGKGGEGNNQMGQGSSPGGTATTRPPASPRRAQGAGVALLNRPSGLCHGMSSPTERQHSQRLGK